MIIMNYKYCRIISLRPKRNCKYCVIIKIIIILYNTVILVLFIIINYLLFKYL